MTEKEKAITINIAKDFSDAPGARYKSDGPKSGEEFFETLLDEKFKIARDENKKLIVNFDGTYGYATSFLSETFSLLVGKYGKKSVLDVLELSSKEDPYIIEWLDKLIEELD